MGKCCIYSLVYSSESLLSSLVILFPFREEESVLPMIPYLGSPMLLIAVIRPRKNGLQNNHENLHFTSNQCVSQRENFMLVIENRLCHLSSACTFKLLGCLQFKSQGITPSNTFHSLSSHLFLSPFFFFFTF